MTLFNVPFGYLGTFLLIPLFLFLFIDIRSVFSVLLLAQSLNLQLHFLHLKTSDEFE